RPYNLPGPGSDPASPPMPLPPLDALCPGTRIETGVPSRLDRLPWSSWHWRVVVALGVTWILDGLQVTIVGAVSGVLREPDALALSDAQVGLAASAYLGGAISGALLFGRITARYGRQTIFLVTLAVSLSGPLLTGRSDDIS